MTFTARCFHCNRVVLDAVAHIGGVEIHALQHHLLSRCRPDETTDRLAELSALLQHYRVAMTE